MLNKLRYKIAIKAIKTLTPDLYKKMKIISLVDTKFCNDKISQNAFTPRPAILFMKRYFNNRLLKGIEIGVEKGLNAKSMLKELHFEKLYLIDIWKDTLEYKEKLIYYFYAKQILGNKVIILQADSQIIHKQFESEFFDFCYIDGNHSYESCYNDIVNWFPKIKTNGIIAGHDTFTYPTVLKAVKNFCQEKQISFTIQLPDWWFIKEAD